MSQRGHQRERDLQKLLTDRGWFCMRAAGSLGAFDLLAVSASERKWPYPAERIMMIEVKSTARGPFAGFTPKDRSELLLLADWHEATPVLAWWPPTKSGQSKLDALVWYWADEWP